MILPLTTHPVVLAAAERLAREFHAEHWRVMDEVAPKFNGRYSREVTATHARLLCDLTRAASRDWWVRYLATHYNFDPETAWFGKTPYKDWAVFKDHERWHAFQEFDRSLPREEALCKIIVYVLHG